MAYSNMFCLSKGDSQTAIESLHSTTFKSSKTQNPFLNYFFTSLATKERVNNESLTTPPCIFILRMFS